MNKKYTGVVNKVNNEFILFTNGEDQNIIYILKDLWQNYIPVHIKINNDVRSLLNEKGEIYYDKDVNNKYTLHINNINIEGILLNNLYKLIDIRIESEEDTNETVRSNS